MGHFRDRQENVHGQPRSVPVFKNITYLPTYQQVEEPRDEELSWLDQRLLDLRVKTTMAPSTQKPYWNTTMVTAWVAVIVGFFTITGAIGGLYLYTDSVAEKRGIEKGKAEAEKQQLERELDAMRKEVFVIKEKQNMETK